MYQALISNIATRAQTQIEIIDLKLIAIYLLFTAVDIFFERDRGGCNRIRYIDNIFVLTIGWYGMQIREFCVGGGSQKDHAVG